MKQSPKKENPAGTGRGSQRVKCACTSCQCTVDIDKAVRKDNLVFCSTMCASHARCTFEECGCEHDCCTM
jgi:hypothetical protein